MIRKHTFCLCLPYDDLRANRASGDHAKANDMMRDALDKLSRLYGPSNAFTVTVATSLYRYVKREGEHTCMVTLFVLID